ncbi:MAG: hypothetical protein QXG03_13385, partial [Halalkalicoccus sp.]
MFDREDEAIIVEDDCVPNDSFFAFCEAMLDRYREDERVMSVNGTNRLETWKADRQDYHFVTYQGVWGWATWRRAWEAYDPAMAKWADPEVRKRMRDALGELKRLQQPYLNWTGKAEKTSFEVDTVSLHVHERVDPATILA